MNPTPTFTKREDFFGGFGNRFFYFETRKHKPPPDPNQLLESLTVKGQPKGELGKRTLKYVTDHPGKQKRKMQQTLSKYFGNAENFNRCFKSLVEADRIERREVDNKRYVYPTE